jgi:SAM-dependent methyltransferase
MKEELFDQSAEYESMLAQGIQLSGESMSYFAHGRIAGLQRILPAGLRLNRILDFGCGLGHTTHMLAASFPQASVIGVDTSTQAIRTAEEMYSSESIEFSTLDSFSEISTCDLCYTNGVFHHIAPADRPAALALIHRALRPRGYLSFFENNPWNIGTRMVMARIPFDRNAETLSPPQARRLLVRSGFEIAARLRTYFFFPRILRGLRFLEPALAATPLGAQYLWLSRSSTSVRRMPGY